MNAHKPFKITDFRRTRRIGVAVSNFTDLIVSACEKFKISKDVNVALSDGTEVLDTKFLFSLPDNTLLFILQRGEKLVNVTDTIAQFVMLTQKISGRTDVCENLQKYLQLNPDLMQKLQMLASNSTVNLSDNRNDDPHWFEGIESRYTSKEAVLRDHAARRMKSYLYKTKDDVYKIFDRKKTRRKRPNEAKPVAEQFFVKLQNALKKYHNHGWYFARSDTVNRICNHEGLFTCQGRYDKTKCTKTHTINPYANAESRISLKTWNFDHVIERSRTIIPAIVKVVKLTATSKIPRRINWKYFYSLLFTANVNLKFVHHVCHILESHTNKTCDSDKFFIELTAETKNNKVDA